MECSNIKELIPFLDDGSIEAETQDVVRIHLEGCPSCRKEYQETVDMLEKVRGVIIENQPAPAPGFIEMVGKKIAKKKKIRALFYRVVPVAAAIVFTISLGLYSFVWRDTTKPVNEQYVTGEIYDEFNEFIASQPFTGYELNELAEVIDVADEKDIASELLVYNNTNITPEDIIEIMDDDDLAMLFAEMER